MDIVFWQIIPSHHQSGALRRLADIWDGEIYGVFDSRQLERRKALGWQSPDLGRMKTVFLDETQSPLAFVNAFCESHPDAIHVLGGFRGCLSVTLAWAVLKKRPNAKLACIAERPHFKGARSILQWLWYRAHFAVHGKQFQAVLAMGTLGVDCFKNLGCPKSILYPYMYQSDFVSSALGSQVDENATSIRFVYLGQLSERKGIDTILSAVLKLPSCWTLDIYGTSGEFEKLVIDAANSKSAGNVFYRGQIRSDEVIKCLGKYDVCLIPSRHDGWGMVTNEALEAGIGVLVSDATGSKDLIEASGAGVIVEADDVSAWEAAMRNILANPDIVRLWKDRATAFRDQISANTIGDYLTAVLRYAFCGQGERPEAPWLTKTTDNTSADI